MGMHAYIVGYKPVDDKWTAMYEIYEKCDAAGITPPKDVLDFFGGLKFDCIETIGIEVKLDKSVVTSWDDGDAREGFEVDIDKIPKDVKYLRFICSY